VAIFLIGFGVLSIVFTFLLAFTIYGEISAVVGLTAVVAGALMLARRSSRRDAKPPWGEH
jgi:hypothetical protein